MSFYSVGATALNNAQLGMTTAGHNIANLNTEGYHRQVTTQATNVPLQTGSGFIGQGAHVDTVKRVYSQFLENQVLQGQTQSSGLATYLSQISQLDNIVADPSSGLSPALQGFFSALGDVATNPASVPSRQALLSSANSMITRFESLSQRFEEVRAGINGQLTESIGLINSYAQQLASVNDQILRQSSGTNQPPNDFLDTRDNLIAKLNEQVRATVVRQDDGTFNVFIGNGQPLVVGGRVFELAASPNPEDQSRIEAAYTGAGGNTILGGSSLDGGVLGGLLTFRSETLDPMENTLGRIAITLATTFNAQHALGQDLTGALGQNFFAVPVPTVLVSTSNAATSGVIGAAYTDVSKLTTDDYRIRFDGANYQVTNLGTNTTQTLTAAQLVAPDAIPGLTLTAPASVAAGDVFTVRPTRFGARDIALSNTINTSTIAAAAPVRVSAALANTGAAKVVDSSITSVPLPALPITLTFDSTLGPNGSFTYGATTVAYTPGSPMTIAGNIQLTLTGTPKTGDQFTIGANTGGVSDNRNALLLAKLQTANTMVGNTTSYQGSYSQLVGFVGNKTAEVKVTAKAQENLLTEAKNTQQQLSGVNLDEEAANLLRFQQAYQAAAKMMQIATTMFDTLLSLGG